MSEEEKTQVNNPRSHFKNLERVVKNKPKANKRKKIIRRRAEINQIENRKRIEQIDETKSWFFAKINKIDELLARLTKGEEKRARDKTQITSIRNQTGHITTDPADIRRVIRSTINDSILTKFAS